MKPTEGITYKNSSVSDKHNVLRIHARCVFNPKINFSDIHYVLNLILVVYIRM